MEYVYVCDGVCRCNRVNRVCMPDCVGVCEVYMCMTICVDMTVWMECMDGVCICDHVGMCSYNCVVGTYICVTVCSCNSVNGVCV